MLKTRKSRAVLLGVSTLLMTTSCLKKDKPVDDDAAFKRAVQGVSAIEDRHLELKISGEIEVSFNGDQKMQFFSRPFGPREKALNRPGLESLKQASVGTVSTRTPFLYAPNRGVIVGISVVGNYTGDGNYTITKRDMAALTPGPATLGTSLSIVRLELFDMDQQPPVAIDRIDTDEAPCIVTLRDDAKKGTLSCPLITDATGSRKVTVTMSWGPLK